MSGQNGAYPGLHVACLGEYVLSGARRRPVS
jgi:hypothetical protein